MTARPLVDGALRRAVAEVDVGALEGNARRLAGALTDGAELCIVVKADGYGHGAVPSARAALAGGATWLAVAAAGEATELRAAGIDARLLVMGALTPFELELALDADADVVVWRERFLERVAAAARGRGGPPARVHVKLDTGMGRLGTRDPREARRVADLASAADGVRLAGVMTHFATADEAGDTFFGRQLETFTAFVRDLRSAHPDVVAHAANSAATLRAPASHFDLVRCGIAFYGMDPANRDPFAHGLEPALALRSHVADVKHAAPGESAGYGRRFVAAAPTRIAVLPIGYADGVRRGLTNNADVLIRGRRFALAGTVSMDNVTVDVGLEASVAAGERATLIGADGSERITAEEVARRLDTINYEVTCGVGPRVPRLHHRDGVPESP